MTTYKDVIYMISDLLKLSSDDASYTNDHLLFLMTKFRALLLKNTYLGKNLQIPQSNYQTLGMLLERVKAVQIECSGSDFMQTTKAIPKTSIGDIKLWAGNYYHNEMFAPVTMERMRFVGHNRYMGNIIYYSINPDWKVVMKSCNPQFYYLDKVGISGIFENDLEAQDMLDSTDTDYSCDIMDRRYPLEEALIMPLVEYVAKELGTVLYNPSDERNDANDQLDEVNIKKPSGQDKS